MYIFPHLDSIAGFMVPFAVVTALAAYVTLGSPALSYGGYQIGLAFYKCTLQAYGPYTELRVLRDRLIGILLGLAVFEFINTHLWPVKATDTIRARLSSMLRRLAEMANLPTKGLAINPLLRTANELRIKANQDLAIVRQLSLGARFEPGAAARQGLESLSAKAEKLLVLLLARAQHQSDLSPEKLPEPVRQTKIHLSTTMALFLEKLADQTAGTPAATLPALLKALGDLEQAVATHIGSITDAGVASHIQARLELCRQAVLVTSQMQSN